MTPSEFRPTAATPAAVTPTAPTMTPVNPSGAPATPGGVYPGPATRSRYALIFGVTCAVLTVAALVLAFAASNFSPRAADAVPSSWSQTYNADLTSGDDGSWSQDHGCATDALGLDADATNASSATCVFEPSVKQNVTGGGFYFEARLAPAAKIPAYAQAGVFVGDPSATATSGEVVRFYVDQQGAYIFCDGSCGLSGGSGMYRSGSVGAWHGNAYLANTIGMKVAADHQTVTVFVNGQQVASTYLAASLSAQPVIAVGAPGGDEAVFTHATLYSGQ